MTIAALANAPLAELPLPWSALPRERLAQRVWRVRLAESSPTRSIIAKLLTPEVSMRVALLARRWLPAVGLADAGPRLLHVIQAASAGAVWHLYEDLGDWALAGSQDEEELLHSLVVLVASLHTSFASHPMLNEIRRGSRDLSAPVHRSTLHDVVRRLGAIRPSTPDRAAVRDRLYARFAGFLEEAPDRVAMLLDLGGPDTLLHGDLWPKNGVVVPHLTGPRARLVDWDRTGVGSAVYDVSTLLSRLPAPVRGRVLGWYRDAAGSPATTSSSLDDLNLLAETCERTRLAEWSRWRLLAVDSPDDDWAWSELAQVEPWLDVPALFPPERRTP